MHRPVKGQYGWLDFEQKVVLMRIALYSSEGVQRRWETEARCGKLHVNDKQWGKAAYGHRMLQYWNENIGRVQWSQQRCPRRSQQEWVYWFLSPVFTTINLGYTSSSFGYYLKASATKQKTKEGDGKINLNKIITIYLEYNNNECGTRPRLLLSRIVKLGRYFVDFNAPF